ncbi:MAG: RnfABCDGE type electron transport complex subunit B [Bacteriovoracaceae bacterium]|nr:RnfABCDGE type electron transport complex subunit B [Bacteriovoracaceae bacterium]
MENLILNSVLSLGATGLIAASILFLAAKKFKVHEDPRIDQIDEILPAANCGGCGLAGCRQFAEACTKADDLDQLSCPVGGSDLMQEIGILLGVEVEAKDREIAVLKCNGSKQNAPAKVRYDGAASCKSAHSLYAGESGCSFGCLGLGDCAVVCSFDALYIDEETGLPVVIDEKCTACGACVKACPRFLFELRPEGPNGQRVYVACMNTEKGAAARKNCKVACIGCTKCTKVTESESVTIKNFLSYIDTKVDSVKDGAELIACCPTKAIIGNKIEANKDEA